MLNYLAHLYDHLIYSIPRCVHVLARYMICLLFLWLNTQLLLTTEMELKVPPLQLWDLALQQRHALNNAMALPVRCCMMRAPCQADFGILTTSSAEQ